MDAFETVEQILPSPDSPAPTDNGASPLDEVRQEHADGKPGVSPNTIQLTSEALAQQGYVHLGARFNDWHIWLNNQWHNVDDLTPRSAIARILRDEHLMDTPKIQHKREILERATQIDCRPNDALMARIIDPLYSGPFSLTTGSRIEGALFTDVIVHRDGTTTPRDRDCFNTAPTIPFPYDGPDDEPVLFKRLITEAIGEHIPWDFILSYAGAALMNDASHQHLLNLYGATRAGKGTIATILERLLGNALPFGDTEEIAYRFALGDLTEHNLVLFPDAPEDFASDNHGLHIVKSLVGGDPVWCQRKYAHGYRIVFGGLVIVNSNFQIRLTKSIADAEAWKRRIIPIHFPHSSEDQIPNYADILWGEEGPLIARAAIRAYLARRHSFPNLPEAIEEARENVVRDNLYSGSRFVRDYYEYDYDALTKEAHILLKLDAHNRDNPDTAVELSHVRKALREANGKRVRRGGAGQQEWHWQHIRPLP